MDERNSLAPVIRLSPPQTFLRRLPHMSCVVPLGLHQGGCRRTSPLALHLTPLPPGREHKVLVGCKWAALNHASKGMWAVSNVFPRRVEITYLLARSNVRIVQYAGIWFKDTGTYTAFCLHSMESNGRAKSYGSSRAQKESDKACGTLSCTDMGCLGPFLPWQVEPLENCKHQGSFQNMLPW